MSESSKKIVTVEQFEKNVEIEAQNLMYFDRLSKEKAFAKARFDVGSKFQVS